MTVQYVVQTVSGALLSPGNVFRKRYLTDSGRAFSLSEDPQQAFRFEQAVGTQQLINLAEAMMLEQYDPSKVKAINLLHEVVGRATPYDPAYVTINLLRIEWDDPRFTVQNYQVVLSTTFSVAYNDQALLRSFYEYHRSDRQQDGKGNWVQTANNMEDLL